MVKKIMPTTYFLILLVLSIVLHFILPIIKIVSRPYAYLGLVLVIFGMVMNIWTDRLFKRRHTTVKPHETPSSFVTSGPFRLSRHPMYLGMMAILLGVAVFLGSLTPFVAPAVFMMLMERLFIPVEEKNMEKRFGRMYLRYKGTVRRWI